MERSVGRQQVDPDKCYSWLNLAGDSADSKSKKRQPDKDSEQFEDVPIPTAPDGGWGWVVVLGAFTVSLICDGVSYCFGVIYSELLVQFKESKSKTSLVGSIFFGVSMTLGPMASALTSRYGCRKMTVLGGLLSCMGMILSMFAPTIDILCVTFSFIVGTGFSLCYISSIVIVSFYFNKRRSLATGMAVCGTGVGTFTFAPMMDYLVDTYDLKGLFLIMGGVCLNLVVCGMLFRPLHFTKAERRDMFLGKFNRIPKSRKDIELQRNPLNADDAGDTMSLLNVPTFVTSNVSTKPSKALMVALRRGKNPHLTLNRYMSNAMLQANFVHDCLEIINKPKPLPAIPSSFLWFRGTSFWCNDSSVDGGVLNSPGTTVDNKGLLYPESPELKRIFSNSSSINTLLSGKLTKGTILLARGSQALITAGTKRRKIEESLSVQSLIRRHSSHKRPKRLTLDKTELGKYLELSSLGPSIGNTDSRSSFESKAHSRSMTPKFIRKMYLRNKFGTHLALYRRDIFFRRLLRIDSLAQSCTVGTSCPELAQADVDGYQKLRFTQRIRSNCSYFIDIVKHLIDCSLLCNSFVLSFLLSNFLYYFWSDVPYMYAADHAIENGIDSKRAAFLLSIIGIFNTLGQVVFGVIGDLNINILNVYAIVSALAGLFVAVVPLLRDFTEYSIAYGLFGFCISVSYPLTTVLLVKYLGLRNLTNSYGLLMLTQGIANFLGPPFAGWVSDRKGNYNYTFYLSGFFYVLSGLALFLVYLPKCTCRTVNKKKHAKSVFSVQMTEVSSYETAMVPTT